MLTTSGKKLISCVIAPWPWHTGHCPPRPVLNEKRAGSKPRSFASGVLAKIRRTWSQIPKNVAGTERGVRPIGD